MLAIIDYGAGNLRSVLHALKHLGTSDMRLAREPQDLRGASKIILPGVGAFGASMAQLRQQGLVAPLKQALAAGIPYLGICVGMQILYEVGEEMGEHAGLGALGGRVIRFPRFDDLKVPHMGWNQLKVRKSCALLDGLDAGSYTYFVHSYYCAPTERATIAAAVDYGVEFAAAIHQDNIFGVQFHPEKSQQTGLRILTNFLRL
ncbi:MAG: imidazole glycerol phosphate synthase subunit HisH [Chloroflexi bacterium]|nr:imidazole glycerol phosphate synthase subunit HisH [Chloroflexota bacterium]MCY4248119.1 imidazole glycerol phosphate synthase subunit HisH [Chloroflexota bacterium]